MMAELSPETIEAAAKAIYETQFGSVPPWHMLRPNTRDLFCGAARAALAAAIAQGGVVPADEGASTYQDDLHDLLDAAGISTNARPVSPHRVMQDEAIPTVRAHREALYAIRGLPSDHDLMHNAMAKAVWTIAAAAIAEGGVSVSQPSALERLNAAVRAMPNLSEASVLAMEEMLRATYDALVEAEGVSTDAHTSGAGGVSVSQDAEGDA